MKRFYVAGTGLYWFDTHLLAAMGTRYYFENLSDFNIITRKNAFGCAFVRQVEVFIYNSLVIFFYSAMGINRSRVRSGKLRWMSPMCSSNHWCEAGRYLLFSRQETSFCQAGKISSPVTGRRLATAYSPPGKVKTLTSPSLWTLSSTVTRTS